MDIVGLQLDQNLVHGISVEVSGQEVKDHCAARAAYHGKRAEMWEVKLKSLLEAKQKVLESDQEFETEEDAIEAYQSPSNMKGLVREPDLRRKFETSANLAARFKFVADHIDTRKRYRLDFADLRTNEFIRA